MKEKNESKEKEEEEISFCDIMKEDTSKMIKETEAKMPIFFQSYSDLYTKYLHLLDDIFGTCYIAEKEFFDKLNIDQGILKQIKKNSEIVRNNYVQSINTSAKFFDEYIKMKTTAIESFDEYFHVMMESYAKTLSQINKSLENNEKR